MSPVEHGSSCLLIEPVEALVAVADSLVAVADSYGAPRFFHNSIISFYTRLILLKFCMKAAMGCA